VILGEPVKEGILNSDDVLLKLRNFKLPETGPALQSGSLSELTPQRGV
jgi:hypothetical protein